MVSACAKQNTYTAEQSAPQHKANTEGQGERNNVGRGERVEEPGKKAEKRPVHPLRSLNDPKPETIDHSQSEMQNQF